ncbi:C-terminal binding protein [Azospirillum sp.]|uniref:C-terminal binding protein n=1 Tax=Azospirillum sp. TaxID=34012 RepID=UPI002D3FB639|nr:C-terminal binding protein [Azospirillum sp.]HYD69813.1 C-terminal binding protein [Azospirillum sp.]
MRVLIPDAKFTDGAAVETATAGPAFAFRPNHGIHQDEIAPEEWRRCDGVIAYDEVRLDRPWLTAMERARVVVRAGVGYDNVDLELAGQLGIAVCNVPDYGTTDVADHALAMLLTLTRGTAMYDEALRRDPVAGWRFDGPPLMRRLRGQVFGVVGLGRIGLAAALRARAFGMDIAFYDPYLPTGAELALGFRRVPRLADLMAGSDVVSVHTPLTPETRGLIGEAALAAAKPGLILINTARGPVVDLDALHAALASGRVAGAALDVLPVEPLARDLDHPLIAAWRGQESWIAGRLLISPHSAFYSPASIHDLRRKSAEVLAAALGEGRLVNCVNRAWLGGRRGWQASA